MNDTQADAVPNRYKLLIASFMALIAAGVGFAVRGALLKDWANEFSFTMVELGTITGGGLVGFGLTIIVCSFFADKLLGYKNLMLIAFVLHFVSVVITLLAPMAFEMYGKPGAYFCLGWGVFIFALGNGVCEAVINPLVASIFTKEKTHYLNILHAGWPAGLIIGGIIAYLFCGDKAVIAHLDWKITLSLYLIPTVIYGIMVVKEVFPPSETEAAGVSLGEMMKQFAAPLLLFLFVIHAMVGYVELGTDSWIANIMENVIGENAFLLFIYTSSIMFVLRFFAGPIVERINPIGLLLISAVLGCVGLYWLGMANTGIAIVAAATTYGVGKTFLWPTMLGVVGERFPRGGAITMGTIGGIGMLSAGWLGGPGIGYKQDYFASQQLEQTDKELYLAFQSLKPKEDASGNEIPGEFVPNEKGFLIFPAVAGLDGAKKSILSDGAEELNRRIGIEGKADKAGKAGKVSDDAKRLQAWWTALIPGEVAEGEHVYMPKWEAKEGAEPDTDGNVEMVGDEYYAAVKKKVDAAGIHGGQMALKWTAAVPAVMALCYLILVFYFKAKGGYKQEVLHGEEPVGEHYTGGVEGPMEA
ncbi:MAG: MFS transporter [Blastopirellula sp.]|nr:MAG: MFS transporter [Blastopirellula sp.]